MSISAEVRWFWLGEEPPGELAKWFHGSHYPPGSPEGRVDVYLLDPVQDELGLKCRDVKENVKEETGVEVKGLVEEKKVSIRVGPLTGYVQIWKKWKSKALTLESLAAGAHGTVKTQKSRWLRKFTTTDPRPAEVELDARFNPVDGRFLTQGCNVELTQITLPDAKVWWSFGLEAFGSLGTVEADLRKVADFLAERPPGGVAAEEAASYPAWLRQFAGKK